MASKFTDEQREQVLDEVRAGTGYRDICQRHGMSISTLSIWVKAAGIETAGASQVQAAVEATKVAWAQRRGDLVDEAGARATQALERIADSADAREAKDWAVTFAVLVDKAQLLSGGVTSRREHLDADRRRQWVEDKQDELAARRAAKGE